MNKVELKIHGMMCEGCVNRVNDALLHIQGVKTVQVSLKDKRAVVTGEDLKYDELVDAVVKIGYKVK